jgi:hypothetical protein
MPKLVVGNDDELPVWPVRLVVSPSTGPALGFGLQIPVHGLGRALDVDR